MISNEIKSDMEECQRGKAAMLAYLSYSDLNHKLTKVIDPILAVIPKGSLNCNGYDKRRRLMSRENRQVKAPATGMTSMAPDTRGPTEVI